METEEAHISCGDYLELILTDQLLSLTPQCAFDMKCGSSQYEHPLRYLGLRIEFA